MPFYKPSYGIWSGIFLVDHMVSSLCMWYVYVHLWCVWGCMCACVRSHRDLLSVGPINAIFCPTIRSWVAAYTQRQNAKCGLFNILTALQEKDNGLSNKLSRAKMINSVFFRPSGPSSLKCSVNLLVWVANQNEVFDFFWVWAMTNHCTLDWLINMSCVPFHNAVSLGWGGHLENTGHVLLVL